MAPLTPPIRQVNLRRQIETQWPGFSDEELNAIGNNCARLADALHRQFGLSAEVAARETRKLARRAWLEHQQEEWLAG